MASEEAGLLLSETVVPNAEELQNVVGAGNSFNSEPLAVLDVKTVEEELEPTAGTVQKVAAPSEHVTTNGNESSDLAPADGESREPSMSLKESPMAVQEPNEDSTVETPKKRGRGRPKKVSNRLDCDQPEIGDQETPKKRGRGRPKKIEGSTNLEGGPTEGEEGEAQEDEPPKKRGRPRKSEGSASFEGVLTEGGDEDETPRKRGRGRPKKSEQSASFEEGSVEKGDEDDGQDEETPGKRGRGRPRKDGMPSSSSKGPPTKHRPQRKDRIVYDDRSDSEESEGSNYRPAGHHAYLHKLGKQKKGGRGRPKKTGPTINRPARKDRHNYNEESETDESFEEYSESDSSEDTIPERKSIAKKKLGRPRKDAGPKGKKNKKRGRGRPRKSEESASSEKSPKKKEEPEYEELSSSEEESSDESDAGDPSFGKSPTKKQRKDEDYCPESYYERRLCQWKKPKKSASGTPKKTKQKVTGRGRGRPKKDQGKKRGRPRKIVRPEESGEPVEESETKPSQDVIPVTGSAKRKRGRPKKSTDPNDGSAASTPVDQKKKPGRPRKSEASGDEAGGSSGEESESVSAQDGGSAAKRKRGRPKGSLKKKRGRGRPRKSKESEEEAGPLSDSESVSAQGGMLEWKINRKHPIELDEIEAD